MKKQTSTQPTLFNTDAYKLPPESFEGIHPDSMDWQGEDAGPCVPEDWEQLMQSQRLCAQIRERIHAIYADAKAEGFDRRLPVEYERAIRSHNGEIIAELERTKELRTGRHNYRGWLGEIYIGESVTRIRIVDTTGWLDYDDTIEGTSKAAAMLHMMQFIDAAIEKEERSPSPLPLVEDDSVTPTPGPVSESVDSVTHLDEVSESISEDDSVTPNEPVSESVSEDDSVTAWMQVSESSAEQKYAPKGTARTTNSYFRYSYKEWGKTKHVHVPGGNTLSAIAQRNWQLVLALKARNAPPSEIVAMIKSM